MPFKATAASQVILHLGSPSEFSLWYPTYRKYRRLAPVRPRLLVRGRGEFGSDLT
jgi:hypothetical protein